MTTAQKERQPVSHPYDLSCFHMYINVYMYTSIEYTPTEDGEASLRRAASGETLVEAPSDADV